MYKIKIFGSAQRQMLEADVNEWLGEHKDILVHHSNLSARPEHSAGYGELDFYLLYTGPDEQGEELKEMAASVSAEQSIEARDINPEILLSTS